MNIEKVYEYLNNNYNIKLASGASVSHWNEIKQSTMFYDFDLYYFPKIKNLDIFLKSQNIDKIYLESIFYNDTNGSKRFKKSGYLINMVLISTNVRVQLCNIYSNE